MVLFVLRQLAPNDVEGGKKAQRYIILTAEGVRQRTEDVKMCLILVVAITTTSPLLLLLLQG